MVSVSYLHFTFLFIFFALFVITSLFFFFNDTATTEIYTLSLHDALPISNGRCATRPQVCARNYSPVCRSEEHTSELQSRVELVCRLLLEKKKKRLWVVWGVRKNTRWVMLSWRGGII